MKRLLAASLVSVMLAIGAVAFSQPSAQSPSSRQTPSADQNPVATGTRGDPAPAGANAARGQGGRGGGRGQAWGVHTHTSSASGTMYPEMMRWLWRDHDVSTDPNDVLERGYHGPAARETVPPATAAP